MSFDMLLLAAEYLDRRQRESEHGYACSASSLMMSADAVQLSSSMSRRRRRRCSESAVTSRNRKSSLSVSKPTSNSRGELRHCIERLKQIVPIGPEATKHTTQRLLSKACSLITFLETSLAEQTAIRDRLIRVHLHLRRRLLHLQESSSYFTVDADSIHGDQNRGGRYTSTQRWRQRTSGSKSRCSTSSDSSVSSMSSLSSTTPETELVDVVGGLDVVGVILGESAADSGCDSTAVSPVTSSGASIFDC